MKVKPNFIAFYALVVVTSVILISACRQTSSRISASDGSMIKSTTFVDPLTNKLVDTQSRDYFVAWLRYLPPPKETAYPSNVLVLDPNDMDSAGQAKMWMGFNAADLLIALSKPDQSGQMRRQNPITGDVFNAASEMTITYGSSAAGIKLTFDPSIPDVRFINVDKDEKSAQFWQHLRGTNLPEAFVFNAGHYSGMLAAAKPIGQDFAVVADGVCKFLEVDVVEGSQEKMFEVGWGTMLPWPGSYGNQYTGTHEATTPEGYVLIKETIASEIQSIMKITAPSGNQYAVDEDHQTQGTIHLDFSEEMQAALEIHQVTAMTRDLHLHPPGVKLPPIASVKIVRPSAESSELAYIENVYRQLEYGDIRSDASHASESDSAADLQAATDQSDHEGDGSTHPTEASARGR